MSTRPYERLGVGDSMSDFAGGLSLEDARCLLALGDGIPYVRDASADGGFLYVGENLARILGHDPAFLLASPQAWGDSLHPDDAAMVLAAVAAAGEEATDIAYRLRHHDGNYLRVCDRFVRRTSPGGGRTIVIGLWTDVTDRQAADEAARRRENQLRHRQKMEAIGQLTGGVAHEFNNLLGVILGNLEIIELDMPPELANSQFMRRAKQSVLRGADLTQRLLTFARKQPLNPQLVDLSILLKDMTRTLALSLGEGIELRIAVDDTVPAVLADVMQLEAALVNLALNARDAMLDGGVLTVTAAVERTPVPGRNAARELVRISVSDTGCGMTRETAARAFEPFFTTKDVGQGTGLGLSAVHGFAEQSGGFAEIETEIGKGTTVSVCLPTAAGAGTAEDGLAETPQPFAHRGTVLVVEDDPDLLMVAAESLRLCGFEVVQAGDGIAALEALRSLPSVDLLFTDIIMPRGLGGVELAAAARQLHPSIAILFTTGYSTEAVEAAGIGRTGPVLRKPYSQQELDLALETALSSCRPASSTA